MDDKVADPLGWIFAKIVSVWAVIGITSWTEAAGFLGFVYTLGMLVKWWWDTVWRDIFIDRGWYTPKPPKIKQGGQARPRMLVALLALSAAGYVGVVQYEGWCAKACIPVPGDVPTIGLGTTGGVKMGDTITPPVAIARSYRDIYKIETGIKNCVTAPLYQYEYDAYTSLAYNIGPTAFCASTLVQKLNAGEYAVACAQITRWDRFKGQPLVGLTIRRAKERQLCEGKV